MMDHWSSAGVEHALRDASRAWGHQQQWPSRVGGHSITPFFRNASSISDLYHDPALTSAMRARSRVINASTSDSTSSALSRGMTAMPSSSPTTMSPGMTTVLPQEIGTLISPGPSLSHPPGQTVRLYAGMPRRVMPSTSRIAPSTMMPPSFFAAAEWHISSPNTALVVLPQVLTTTMSPGSAI